MAKRAQPEQIFHKAVAEFLDAALPFECWWTTFPAGGGGKARGGQLKAMGLKPGVADILVLSPRRPAWRTDVIWIELKSAKGRASPEQKAFADRMYELPSAFCFVCRSLEEVQEALDSVFVKLRARVTRRAAA